MIFNERLCKSYLGDDLWMFLKKHGLEKRVCMAIVKAYEDGGAVVEYSSMARNLF